MKVVCCGQGEKCLLSCPANFKAVKGFWNRIKLRIKRKYYENRNRKKKLEEKIKFLQNMINERDRKIVALEKELFQAKQSGNQMLHSTKFGI